MLNESGRSVSEQHSDKPLLEREGGTELVTRLCVSHLHRLGTCPMQDNCDCDKAAVLYDNTTTVRGRASLTDVKDSGEMHACAVFPQPMTSAFATM